MTMMDHDFYSLDDAAEALNCKKNDLLKWGAAGKIKLCVWYDGPFTECPPDDDCLNDEDSCPFEFETVWVDGELKRLSDIVVGSIQSFVSLREEDIMRLFISTGSYLPETLYIDRLLISEDWLVHPVWEDNKGNAHHKHLKPTIDDLFVTKETFDAIRKNLESLAEHAAEKPLLEYPVLTTTDFIESLPSEPEKPLRTMQAIAKYCGVHESTVKDWRKNYKDFPASPPGSGTVTALPSKLNAWMIKKGKK